MGLKILVINPGSTSTKIAIFDGENPLFEEEIQHNIEDLKKFRKIKDQYEWRKEIILNTLKEKNIDIKEIKAVVGRGGLMKPVESGTYRITEEMIRDLNDESLWGREHASNLGCMIAYQIGKEFKIPSFTVDPVTVDEMEPVAKISGMPEIERKSLVHALNIRAVARIVCEKLNKRMDEVNFVIAHLGGGISVCAYKNGKMVDVNNALLGMGPFSPQRCGSLPIGDLVEICYSGKYTKEELIRKLSKEGGLVAYLGTDKIPEIVERIEKKNDKKAELVLNAMIYQIAKEIGAMATVLEGKLDGIIITGGIANCDYVIERLKKRISFLGPVWVYPKQNEMKALALGALHVLSGKEKEKVYGKRN